MNRWPETILSLTLLLAAHLVNAQKTDTITFYNGDRAICEIKELFQGKLLIKTVAMGTISVEWRKVSNVVSNKEFEIILSDHSKFFGRINGVDSLRNAILSFGIFVQSVPLNEIVALSPIDKNFWLELDGSLSIGFSYSQGTDNLQFNSSGDATYRTRNTVNTISYSSTISSNTATTSEKQDAGYRFQYYYKNRIFNAIDFRWERNTELAISSRLLSTLSLGYNLIESRANLFSIELGGSGNRELTTEGIASNNLEGLLRINYSLFIFASPKILINVVSETFPSFTVKDRIRSNLDTKISWEIFSDFTFSITFYGNYDNNPSVTDIVFLDWGTTSSIGYTF